MYIPHTNEWAVFRLEPSGKARVLLRQSGIDGLGQAVLLMTQRGAR